MTEDDMRTIHEIVERIKPVMRGHRPEIQSAAMADCVALWLAGHQVEGDGDLTRQLRAALLAGHCALVRELVPLNAQLIGTTP